jgi:hypothetical protein
MRPDDTAKPRAEAQAGEKLRRSRSMNSLLHGFVLSNIDSSVKQNWMKHAAICTVLQRRGAAPSTIEFAANYCGLAAPS